MRELGFEVALLAGAVGRELSGDGAEFNHLILLVQLDKAYLADVGFGNGFLEPLTLEMGEHRQRFSTYHLTRLDEVWWRYSQDHPGPSFDFTLQPYHLSDFAQQCHDLQTSPESGFVRMTVCHRFTPQGILSLRGAVVEEINDSGRHERVIDTFAAYHKIVTEAFSLPLTKLEPLWERVWERHLAWQASL